MHEVERPAPVRPQRLRALEMENAELKRLLADAMLDNAALKELLGKKW
jgi:putative transposase